MRVLVACEFSGVVRDAFAARGHFARSVDLLPTEQLSQAVTFRGDFGCMTHPSYEPDCEECEYDEPWCHAHGMYAYECPCLGPTEDEAEYADDCEHGARHLSGDLFTVEDIDGYDPLIAHPSCTRLTNSGVRWLHAPPPGKTLGRHGCDCAECEAIKHVCALATERVQMGRSKLHRRANRLKEALSVLLERYVEQVNSGDCGSWNPEEEDEVIQARAAMDEGVEA